jgi:predicted nucleic acid-binding protein
MNRIVSNASPLIYLAKANRLQILLTLYDQTLIPDAVYREVVIKGKHLGEKDAVLVEKAITEREISVRSVKRMHTPSLVVHTGEVEVISLALEEDINTVLMDDAKGRMAADMLGLKARGTLWLLLRAVRRHMLTFDAFITALEDVTRMGFYLREDVYLRAIREARRLSRPPDQ